MQTCSLGLCTCDQDLAASVCCCRGTEMSPLQGVTCPEGIDSLPQNASSCGCSVCDSIVIEISLSVEVMTSRDPVRAAPVFRVESSGEMTQLGITDNFGRFHHSEMAEARTVDLRVQAPGFFPREETLNLLPNTTSVPLTLVLMPIIEIPMGVGASPLNLRLGPVLSISTPPNAFINSDGEIHQTLVVFQGNMIKIEDGDAMEVLPNNNFTLFDQTGAERRFGVLMGFVAQFVDESGRVLQQREGFSLSVSVTSVDLELLLLAYNSSGDSWDVISELAPAAGTAVVKRQTATAVEFNGISKYI